MSAVDAAVAVAAAHGVRCEKPVVLSEAWHVLVHLWPAPGGRARDERRCRRRSRPTSNGSSCRPSTRLTRAHRSSRPSDLLPPGPHRHDGHTLVFWRYLAQAGKLDASRGRPRAPRDPRVARGLRRRAAPCRPRRGCASDARSHSRRPTTSSSSASSPRASFRRDKRCTATPTSSTASKPLPARSGTTWRRLAAGRVNTTSPRSSWATARAMPIRRLGPPPPHMGSYDEDILERALPVYAAWVAASFMVAIARRPDSAAALERQLRFLRRFRN